MCTLYFFNSLFLFRTLKNIVYGFFTPMSTRTICDTFLIQPNFKLNLVGNKIKRAAFNHVADYKKPCYINVFNYRHFYVKSVPLAPLHLKPSPYKREYMLLNVIIMHDVMLRRILISQLSTFAPIQM